MNKIVINQLDLLQYYQMVRVESCREAASIMGAKVELQRIKSQTADKQRIQKVIGKRLYYFLFNFSNRVYLNAN